MSLVLWLTASLAAAETPLSLDQTVAMALERNPNIRSAELTETIARIARTRAELDRVTAQLAVSSGATAGVTKPWDAPAVTATDATWEARATAVAPLYTGGRIGATIDQAAIDADVAAIDTTLTRRDVVRAAYTAYWTLKGFELQIAAAEEGLAASQEALDIIRSKADSGLAAGIDVNRSTVDLYSQQDSLINTRAAMDQAEQDLLRLLHLGDEDLVLTSDPPAQSADAIVVPELPSVARPELARQRLTEARAAADVRIARSAALPTVSVTATTGIGADAAGAGVDGIGTVAVEEGDIGDLGRPTLDAVIGIELAWNPFDLLRTHDAIRSAKLARDRTVAADEAERDRLDAEIRSAAIRVAALRERYPLMGQQRELARDNQTIVQDLYAQGSATILDLFNAQSAFRAAAIQEAGLAVDLATAELDLAWLLGEDVTTGARQ
ncbi:MAG: TolC family protein [Myxococcota bacterium]